MRRPKIKKTNTSLRKKRRKDTSKALAARAAQMINHPTECCVCSTEFVRNRTTVKTWHVTIREDRVKLACPGCWQMVLEKADQPNED